MPDDEIITTVSGSHGYGALPSPPDERDYQITELLSSEQLLAAPPAAYNVPNLSPLPVLDQGISPMCVAFAHSSLKMYEDKKDQGQYFNFNEPYFFQLIGGNQFGAFIRNALDRLRIYGYPIVGLNEASRHKISAYYAVPKNIDTIKQAVMAFGPVIMGLHWFQSWENVKSNGQLPPPSGAVNGHCIEIVGWDYRGFRLRNSWGSQWGLGGDCYMPYSYVMGYAFEFWKAIDQTFAPVNVFTGYHVIIEGAYTMHGYVVGTGCTMTARPLHFTHESEAPVTKGYCGGKSYWRTSSGPLTGISYVCGMTEYGWHIVKRYRRPDGTTYDVRIPCTGS